MLGFLALCFRKDHQLTCRLITGPLFTISVAMQVSVLPFLHAYGDAKPEEVYKHYRVKKPVDASKLLQSSDKALIKVTEERRLLLIKDVPSELMKASGQVGLNKPFRATAYRTYREAIEGLYRQGLLGFYKGNGCRCLHLFGYQIAKNNFQFYCESEENIFKENSFMRDFACASIASLAMHPFHFAEARYVLQNRLPGFQSYKSAWNFITNGLQDLHRGLFSHIPRSFILALTGFNYMSSVSLQSYFG